MILTRLQTLNEAMAADEGSRAKEAFSEAVGIFYRICLAVFYFGSFFFQFDANWQGMVRVTYCLIVPLQTKFWVALNRICSLWWLHLIWTSYMNVSTFIIHFIIHFNYCFISKFASLWHNFNIIWRFFISQIFVQKLYWLFILFGFVIIYNCCII